MILSFTATPRCKPVVYGLRSPSGSRPWVLSVHPEKTKVVYCKDANRPGDAEHTSFDYLGYTFRGRLARGPRGYFMSFAPAIAPTARKAISHTIRALAPTAPQRSGPVQPRRGDQPASERLDRLLRSLLSLRAALPRFPHRSALVRWARHKFKRLRYSPVRAWAWLAAVKRREPGLFVHWQAPAATEGSTCKSRMTGDCHVRFCERRGVRFPPATRLRVRPMGPPMEDAARARRCGHRAVRRRCRGGV